MDRRVSVLYAYAAALALCVGWGLLVLRPNLLDVSAVALALSVPVGLAIGVLAGRCDRAIIRRANRRTVRRRATRGGSGERRAGGPGPRRVRTTAVQVGGQSLDKRRSLGLHRIRQPTPEEREIGLGEVVSVGALEELVYRGVLVSACFLLPGSGYVALALVGLVVAFALPHVWFGWTHVAAKLPLSALAMGSVLALGTVVPAVVAHVLFNVRVRQELRVGTYTAPGA